MKIIRSLLAVFVGLLIGFFCTIFVGENPIKVFNIILHSSFSTLYDIGLIISYSVPLIFTGLSISLAYKSGFFNIGAEGQLTIGALVTAIIGSKLNIQTGFLGILIIGMTCFFSAGIWAYIPAYLKEKRSVHEVISTIMLNFIAAGIAAYFAVHIYRDTLSQNPQTEPIKEIFKLNNYTLFLGSPVNITLFLSIFIAIVTFFFLYKTSLGFEIRSLGENQKAAESYGISAFKVRSKTLFLAGGIAGLAGFTEVLGRFYCYKIDFSPGYGFTGIVVAFLARHNPIAIIFSAFLFGIIQKSCADLEIYTQNVTSDLALIFQAIILVIACSDEFFQILIRKRLLKLS